MFKVLQQVINCNKFSNKIIKKIKIKIKIKIKKKRIFTQDINNNRNVGDDLNYNNNDNKKLDLSKEENNKKKKFFSGENTEGNVDISN